MSRLAPLDLAFLALESPTRPMHAGALMVFEPPAGEDRAAFADRVAAAFQATPAADPFNRRIAGSVPGLQRWEQCDEVDLAHHVRRVALPAPGSIEQLMELVGHLYVGLLDRSQPLWECYLIDALEGGRIAVLLKLHHALGDGISGVRILFGSLADSPADETIRPVWAERPSAPRRRTPARASAGLGGAVREARAQATAAAALGAHVAETVPRAGRLRDRDAALPFYAPRVRSAQGRQTSSRSFAIFDLPLDTARQTARRAGGSVNDLVLSVCDDALHRYYAERGEPVDARLLATMAVSTRGEGDTSTSNAAALAHVRLGAADARPRERLEQIVRSTTATKAAVRGTPASALQLSSLAFFGAAELRERLPVGRGTVPPAANLLVSNIPGGPQEPRYLGGGRLTGIYAAPILPPAHPLNVTLVNYAGSLCFGLAAARGVIPDTARIAALALDAFAELRPTPRRRRATRAGA